MHRPRSSRLNPIRLSIEQRHAVEGQNLAVTLQAILMAILVMGSGLAPHKFLQHQFGHISSAAAGHTAKRDEGQGLRPGLSSSKTTI